MSTNNTDAIKQIVDSVDSMIETKINSAGFDKTRWGEITAVNADGTYNVTVDGREYTSIKTVNTNLVLGDVVTITYPNNQSTNAFIINSPSIDSISAGIYKKMYPIGVIFEWCDSGISTGTAPDLSTVAKVQEYFGFGTWEAYGVDRMLVGAGNSYSVSAEGGEATHTLTQTEMPDHRHTFTTNSAGAHTHATGHKRVDAYGTGNADAMHFSGTFDVTSSSAGAHTHSGTTNGSGGSQAHNNMPPYVAVYRYRRIA